MLFLLLFGQSLRYGRVVVSCVGGWLNLIGSVFVDLLKRVVRLTENGSRRNLGFDFIFIIFFFQKITLFYCFKKE